MNPRNALLVAAIALAGCDPFVFDDLQDQTWVDATERPDGIGSVDYVAAIVVAATDETTGAQFNVAGNEPAGIGALRYGESGNLESSGVPLRDLDPGLETGLFRPRVPIAGSPVVVDEKGSVALGLPDEENGFGQVIIVEAEPGFSVRRPFTLPPNTAVNLGDAVTFAVSALGDAASPELFAAATDTLVLWTDALAGTGVPNPELCAVDREQIYTLHAADVSAATDGDELVVMEGSVEIIGGAASTVVVLAPQTVADAAAADDGGACLSDTAVPARTALLTIDAPGGEPDFGLAIASGDFDGGGGTDLAIAAPSTNTVYVYLNVDADSGTAPAPIAVTRNDGVSFGAAIAVGDLDGGADELVVGDPGVAADGTPGAGTVYVLQEAGGAFSTGAILHDFDPERDQAFGRAVAVVPFGADDNILVVGTNGELFTYFQTPLTGDTDVRVP